MLFHYVFLLLAWLVSWCLDWFPTVTVTFEALCLACPRSRLSGSRNWRALEPQSCTTIVQLLVLVLLASVECQQSMFPCSCNARSQNVQQARILQSLCANTGHCNCQVPWECSVQEGVANSRSEQNSHGATCVCGNSSPLFLPATDSVHALG